MKRSTTLLSEEAISQDFDKYETPVHEGREFDYCYCQNCLKPVVPSYYPESKLMLVMIHIAKMFLAISLLVAGGFIWDQIQIYFN